MKMMKLSRRVIVTAILIVVLYFAVGYLIKGEIINPFQQVNLFLMGINIIMAVSLNLLVGFTGQLALGHAGFMAIGAYVAAIFTVKLHLPFALGIVAGAVAAAITGVIIGLPTLRLRGDYLAIATLGFAEIIRVVFVNTEYVGGAAGLIGIPQLTNWTWLYFLTIATVLLIKNFIDSTHGRACISVRENEIAAETMGINTTKYKVLAFSMGAFFAGVAGALYAHYFFLIQPVTFSFLKSFDALVMVVLGGLGSISGSIIAALLVTGLTAALQSLAALRMVIYAAILIVVMVYRPQGLMGTKEITFAMFTKERGETGDRGVKAKSAN